MQEDNIHTTQKYFDSWQTYQEEVATCFSELYRNCGAHLNAEIGGRILDVGSGGIFNYDVLRAAQLVAVDYSIKAIDLKKFPPNVALVQGDSTQLPFATGSFDGVVMQFLIHHLALEKHPATVANVERGLAEGCRVLRPGGKLLVMESFVPPPLECAERLLYPVTRRLLRWVGQPMVFQFSPATFTKLLSRQAIAAIDMRTVSKGKYISQCGLKVPGWLSPCLIRLVMGRKPGA